MVDDYIVMDKFDQDLGSYKKVGTLADFDLDFSNSQSCTISNHGKILIFGNSELELVK